MRVSKRSPVHKGASASQFRKGVQRTKAANLPRTVMRGGWRL